MYCEFWDGFVEYYDLSTDPYHLYNSARQLGWEEREKFRQRLDGLRGCKGRGECFKREEKEEEEE